MKMDLPLNMVFFQLMKMKILLNNNGVFSPFFQLVILVFCGGGLSPEVFLLGPGLEPQRISRV